jgi:hypothetical protein
MAISDILPRIEFKIAIVVKKLCSTGSTPLTSVLASILALKTYPHPKRWYKDYEKHLSTPPMDMKERIPL